jgi:hypothetical protein
MVFEKGWFLRDYGFGKTIAFEKGRFWKSDGFGKLWFGKLWLNSNMDGNAIRTKSVTFEEDDEDDYNDSIQSSYI